MKQETTKDGGTTMVKGQGHQTHYLI